MSDVERDLPSGVENGGEGEGLSNVVPQERTRKHIEATADSESDEELDPALGNGLAADDDEEGAGGAGVYGVVDEATRKRQELEARMDSILHKPKKKRTRQDEDDLEQMQDERILRLKDEMNIAAQKDIDTLNERLESGNTRLVAMEKVKLLPKVVKVLSKVNLADTILDNNLLQSVRIWLEPLPDGSLPAFEIQKSLFSALDNLPIKTEHLKESGLGRVVIFYTKSKRVEQKLARLADKLIAEWTRPIIGASDNYRDKRVLKLEFDVEKHRKKTILDTAKSKKRKSKRKEVDEEKYKSAYEQAAARRNRAAAPAQTTTDYKYAPISNIDATGKNIGVGSSVDSSDLYKRLNSRLSGNKNKKTNTR